MQLVDGNEAADRLEDIVHRDTQVVDDGVDLTVGEIFSITSRGALDFGGSEFVASDRTYLEPKKRNADDDYGWWELKQGTYVVRYNETLTLDDTDLVRVQPLARLLDCAVTHPTYLTSEVDGPLEMTITVGEPGVDLKENVRASRLQVLTQE